MSGPFGSSQWMYSSGGFYDFPIEQSLRINQADTAYLSKTLADSEGRIFTFSAWVKRGKMTATSEYIFATGTGSSAAMYLYILNQKLYYWDWRQSGNGNILESNAVFRDPSAWYHIVLEVDRTAATASDRAKLYVNGEEVSYASTTYPNQNEGSWANENRLHYISNSVNTVDGYLAEVNFIDGQALDPTSFGEFKSGVWIPKQYGGTYGTNGFRLSFADSSNIGDDTSGNTNDWTANSLVATDVLLDSPTNNFATLNNLYTASVTNAFSEGNLKIVTPASGYGTSIATNIPPSSKYYAEFLANDTNAIIGIRDASLVATTSTTVSDTATNCIGWYAGNGNFYYNGVSVLTSGNTYGSGDVIGVAIDYDGGSVSWYKNGVLEHTQSSLDLTNVIFAIGDFGSSFASTLIANFGQDSSFAGNKTAQGNTDANGIGDFYYAPPSGYLALCTANLPDPVIDPAQDDVPSDYFGTLLWTGDGTSSRAITGLGFQPDFIWQKSRSSASNHNLVDAVRGIDWRLISQSTIAEVDSAFFASFDNDGFSLDNANDNDVNLSGNSYVAWNWLAGNGTSSNTDGSISSTVSVNQKAGFSIATFTLPTSGSCTYGHGLTQAPEVVIVKTRNTTLGWTTYHKDTGVDKYLYLNTTASAVTDTNVWNPMTSTTVGLDAGFATLGDCVAYQFHSVEGYSKFGSYTGNGSTDGPFVYTGFRPAWVMVKRTSTGGTDWELHDTTRSSYNVSNRTIRPNSSAAEIVYTDIDMVSNGFKLRSNAVTTNSSGDTFIYMAFAENPFKYATAR